MIIETLDRSGRFLEANVVESRERSAVDIFNGMIGDEEVLFPPHKNEVGPLQSFVIKRVRIKSFGILAKRFELALQLQTKE